MKVQLQTATNQITTAKNNQQQNTHARPSFEKLNLNIKDFQNLELKTFLRTVEPRLKKLAENVNIDIQPTPAREHLKYQQRVNIKFSPLTNDKKTSSFSLDEYDPSDENDFIKMVERGKSFFFTLLKIVEEGINDNTAWSLIRQSEALQYQKPSIPKNM